MAFSGLQARLPRALQPFGWLIVPLGIFGLLIVAIAVIVPAFLDGKTFADRMAQRIEVLTGRSFTYESVSVSVLPAPKIILYDVRLQNAPGTTRTYMLQVPTVTAPLSFAAVLSGNMNPNQLILNDASMDLETLSDGTDNWHFSQSSSSEGLEDVTVLLRNAQISYTDKQDGYAKTLQSLNASLQLGAGRVGLRSDFYLDTVRTQVSANCKDMVFAHLQDFKSACALSFKQGDDEMSFDGDLTRNSDGIALQGDAKVSHQDIRSWLDAFYGKGGVPFSNYFVNPLPLEMEAELVNAGERLLLNASRIESGEALSGTGFYDFSAVQGAPKLNVQLTATKLDLDALLGNSVSRGSVSSHDLLALPEGLPVDLTGALQVTAEQWTLSGLSGVDARLSGVFARGGLEVALLQMGLADEGRISTKGRMVVGAHGLRYDGIVDVGTRKFADLSPALGIDATAVPLAYNQPLRARFATSATFHEVKVNGLQMLYGNSRLSGGLTLKPLEMPTQLDTQISVDQFDFSPLWKLFFGEASLNTLPQDMAYNPFLLDGLRRLGVVGTHDVTVGKAQFLDWQDVALQGAVTLQPNKLGLQDMRIQGDNGTDMSVNALVTAREKQVPMFNLAIDANRISLPSVYDSVLYASDKEKALLIEQNRPVSQWSATAVSFAPLSHMQVELELKADRLEIGEMAAQDVEMTGALLDNSVKIDSLQTNLWDGRWVFKGTLDLGLVPNINIAFKAAGADAEPMLQQLFDVSSVQGPISMGAQFQASGVSMADWMETLRGPISMKALGTKLRGLDVPSIMQIAKVNGANNLRTLLESRALNGTTTLNSMDGALVFDQGYARFNNVTMQLEGAAAAVNGTVRLSDYAVNAQMDMALGGLAARNETAPTMGLKLRGSLPEPNRVLETQDLENFLSRR